ncbi:hypothetical protein JKF63_03362 [Porcisia hertigi]|uniref:SH3 domain-containing protein n=1 Tax=Porcisia hertigi TaxID=2761500 RepID=A0A836LHA0_9TRYP|nr:hypothetical protein JKF63_03362 [Porcisia hertigi]
MTAAVSLFERNKRVYLEEESKLESLVRSDQFLRAYQSWLDQSISQLDFQYERCEQQLSELQQHVAAPKGDFWNSKAVIEHCNLHLAEGRLLRRSKELEGNQHADLPAVIQLVSTLQQTKSSSFITPRQRRFIEESEAQLKSVIFEPRDLSFITNALQTKLIDDGNTRGFFSDLTTFQNTIDELSPDIDQCEQLLEASIANGEMGLAEDISSRQLDVYEHILRLITDQYPIISNYYTESHNSERRRRWAIFRMVSGNITAVIEAKHRLIETCEEDLLKIQEQMANYNCDDGQQRKRYEADRTESDEFLQQNKEKQQSVWNRIFSLFQELQTCSSELTTLAQKRRKEVERRLQMEEREAGRRSGHESFLQAAMEHAQKLQDTIDNAASARDIAMSLNDFVLDGCDNIASKYDKQQHALGEMLRLVQQHHFTRFSDYYIAASRYLYRKERRLQKIDEEMQASKMQRELFSDTLNPQAKEYAEAEQRLSIQRQKLAQEVMHIRQKLERAEWAVTPTLRSLDFAGITYVHPRLIVEKMNLNRWSTVLDYRTIVVTEADGAAAVVREAAAIETLRSELEAEKMSTHNRHQHQKQLRSVDVGGATAPSTRQSELHAASAAGIRSTVTGTAAVKPSALSFVERVHAMVRQDSFRFDKESVTGASSSLKGVPDAVGHAASLSRPVGNSTTSVVSDGGVVAETSAATAAPAAPLPTHMEGATFQALFDYRARAPDELTFEAGQQIVCISRASEEGWFKGVCNQRTGLFPINYVQPVCDASATR